MLQMVIATSRQKTGAGENRNLPNSPRRTQCGGPSADVHDGSHWYNVLCGAQATMTCE